MTMRLAATLMLALTATLGGCGTIADIFIVENADSSSPRVYGGTRVDARLIADGNDKSTILTVFFVLDMPFSFGVDTALLIFTLPWSLFAP